MPDRDSAGASESDAPTTTGGEPTAPDGGATETHSNSPRAPATADADAPAPDTFDVDVSAETASEAALRAGDPEKVATELLLPMRQQKSAIPGDDYEIEEQYWVNRPFTYVMILRNTRRADYEYRVVEPPLSEFERTLYHELMGELKDRLLYRVNTDTNASRAEQLESNVRRSVDDLGVQVSEASLQKVLYYLRRDMIHYGQVDPLMNDPRLEEISVNGPRVPVFVYHRKYEGLDTNIMFQSDEWLNSFVTKLAQRSGADISVADPMQGVSLPDGSRVQLSLGDEVTARGSTITIRKFRDEPFSPVELVKYDTFTLEQMAYLWMLIANGYSGIIAGGTGSGKTTSLNAFSMFIPPKEKIVTIEDTREVQLPHDNWIPAITREGYSNGDSGIDMGDLLIAALRQRPEYMVVGEVRGEEAYTMFQAMNTGHTTYSTLHADSVQTAVSRLENNPIGVERELISELGFLSIQNVAYVDGNKVRRNNELIEIEGLDEERELNYRTIFRWDEATDSIRRISDSHHATTLRKEGKNPEQSIKTRYTVLKYLLENDITDYDPVTTVVSSFATNPEVVLEMVEQERLNFDELERLAERPLTDDEMTNQPRGTDSNRQ